MKELGIYVIASIFLLCKATAQENEKIQVVSKKTPKVLYGTASFYANKFEGRETASGEIFSQKKLTAACNVLPLGTWIKVTNLHNKRSVIVKVNDRLHYRMKRVVDLSKAAAKQLNYTNGLIHVKVEVLGKKKPT
jgi:rare lipoprotein A